MDERKTPIIGQALDDYYLLYIDVLGFADLVDQSPFRVDDLFEIVASLNVHTHRSFSTIVFSDTILVHNMVQPSNDDDHRYFVMYECEFYQDLINRLIGRGVWLRGVLTHGPFQHYELNSTPYFYGPALNRAYSVDKKLELTGLVMDDHCRAYSNIFSNIPLQQGWHYVFVTQGLDQFEHLCEGRIPVPRIVIEDLGWQLGPELEMLAGHLMQSKTHPDIRARQKHMETLRLYRSRYPKTFATLEHLGFRMEAVSDCFEWRKVRERMREDYSWASERRGPTAGGLRRSARSEENGPSGRPYGTRT